MNLTCWASRRLIDASSRFPSPLVGFNNFSCSGSVMMTKMLSAISRGVPSGKIAFANSITPFNSGFLICRKVATFLTISFSSFVEASSVIYLVNSPVSGSIRSLTEDSTLNIYWVNLSLATSANVSIVAIPNTSDVSMSALISKATSSSLCCSSALSLAIRVCSGV